MENTPTAFIEPRLENKEWNKNICDIEVFNKFIRTKKIRLDIYMLYFKSGSGIK